MARARWFSPLTLLLVIVGGAVGATARALLTLPLPAQPGIVIPAVTLGVNVLGSFLLGVVVGIADDHRPRFRAFWGTGVLGGFTTYSAFAVQIVTVGGSSPVVGLALAIVSLFGGLVVAALGLSLGRRIAGRSGAEELPEDAE